MNYIAELPHAEGARGEPPPPRGTPYNGLYGEALFKRATLFRLLVYERVRISQVEVYMYKRVGILVI